MTTLSTNFDVSPYFDDYNEDKDFYRILFRPSVAVQARELTQLQTILQNQIQRFGEHVFKDGSKELEKYSTLVNEYIGVFEELLPSLKEGNISIKELKDKKQINRLLSLVGGESGEGFYKKYALRNND